MTKPRPRQYPKRADFALIGEFITHFSGLDFELSIQFSREILNTDTAIANSTAMALEIGRKIQIIKAAARKMDKERRNRVVLFRFVERIEKLARVRNVLAHGVFMDDFTTVSTLSLQSMFVDLHKTTVRLEELPKLLKELIDIESALIRERLTDFEPKVN